MRLKPKRNVVMRLRADRPAARSFLAELDLGSFPNISTSAFLASATKVSATDSWT